MKKLILGVLLIGALFAEVSIPAEYIRTGRTMGNKHYDVMLLNISNDYCIFIDKDNIRWLVTAPFEIKFKNVPAK